MTVKLRQQALGAYVRALRRRAGLSLRKLAAQTDFSPSFISQLERGEVSPSIHSMEKIAGALGTTLGTFFAAVAGADGSQVVRARQRKAMTSSWSRADIQALAPLDARPAMEPILVTLRARGRSGKHPVSHASEEFAFVLEGRVSLRVGPDEHLLGPGDAIVLRAGESRLWTNPGAKRTRILIVALRRA